MRSSLSALSLVLALAVSSAQAATDPVAKADALLEQMKSARWSDAVASFDSAMKGALPAEKLEQVWAQLRQQVGPLASAGVPSSVIVGDLATVRRRLQFEAAALDMTVAVHQDTGEIAGLFFAAAGPEPQDPGTPPEAAASSSSAKAPIGASDAAAIAAGFIDALASGRYDEAAARFEGPLAVMLPKDKVAQTWEDLTQRMGPLESKGDVTTTEREGMFSTLQRLGFKNGPLEARLNIGRQTGGVAGLLFAPAEAARVEAPAGSPFTERPVRIGEGPGGLDGVLTMPSGGAQGIVVLVHGSGPHDRDETIGQNAPFRDLAWGLAERGIATVRYDKRTLAQREAIMPMVATLTLDQETVLDAAQAVRQARALVGSADAPVVLLGHSLGGMAAPRIAAKAPGLAGLVLMAAPAEPLEEAILRQTRYIAGQDGLDDAEKAQIAEMEKQVARVKSPELSLTTPSMSLPLGLPPAYWLDLRGHDVPKELAQVPLPMLFLQGGRDYQVTLKDLDAFRRALAGRRDVTFRVFPQLSHLFIVGAATPGPGDYMVAGHVAPEVIDAIAQFVRSLAPPRAATLP